MLTRTALTEGSGDPLDAFTAALDTAAREWLRSDGTADRAALIDQAFTLLAPRL
ncbi:hypothetical protein AB0C69_31935 [Actinomadura sp. NPDC048032]|uniref:hypothetical protein n=1 Tax=Actinomadura sp. NPDC048032 TaxID=3155747 RepID=UPI0033E3A07E